jgi:DNA-binding transcriptional LysR family regulator
MPAENRNEAIAECIGARYSSGALYRWEFERHGEAMRIDVPGSLTLGEPYMMAQASRAGLGLAYVGEWMVADDITSGRLVDASLRAFVDLAKEMVFRNRAAS